MKKILKFLNSRIIKNKIEKIHNGNDNQITFVNTTFQYNQIIKR